MKRRSKLKSHCQQPLEKQLIQLRQRLIKRLTISPQPPRFKQNHDQLSDVSSNAIQTAISDSVSEWLQAHPVVFQLVQLLLWAANHPIISLIILVFYCCDHLV